MLSEPHGSAPEGVGKEGATVSLALLGPVALLYYSSSQTPLVAFTQLRPLIKSARRHCTITRLCFLAIGNRSPGSHQPSTPTAWQAAARVPTPQTVRYPFWTRAVGTGYGNCICTLYVAVGTHLRPSSPCSPPSGLCSLLTAPSHAIPQSGSAAIPHEFCSPSLTLAARHCCVSVVPR